MRKSKAIKIIAIVSCIFMSIGCTEVKNSKTKNDNKEIVKSELICARMGKVLKEPETVTAQLEDDKIVEITYRSTHYPVVADNQEERDAYYETMDEWYNAIEDVTYSHVVTEDAEITNLQFKLTEESVEALSNDTMIRQFFGYSIGYKNGRTRKQMVDTMEKQNFTCE